MMGRQQVNEKDNQTRILDELSALVFSILRSPATSVSFQQITPAGFASLLLGMLLSMMVCGSLTFFLGFMLMPWVLGLALLLYFVEIVSMIGRAILCCNSAPPMDIPSWKLL